MKYQVVEEHKSNNRNPIKVNKGEKVKLGRKSGEDDGWSNWIYCFSLDSNTEGWIPEQIIKFENQYGIILYDYSAKELEVNKDQIVDGEFELNGWVWCCILNTFDLGWVPKEKIVNYTQFNNK